MARSRLRTLLPWWLRMGAKMALARLPIPYAFWKRLHLFEHGTMDQPSRALNGFLQHAQTAGVLDAGSPVPRLAVCKTAEFNVLELGPGDSLFTAVIARSLGASHAWLVDSGAFATASSIAGYGSLIRLLRQNGLTTPFDVELTTLDEVLANCNGQYLTQGVPSLAQLPSACVDFCYSNAVLEHIPKGDFPLLADELKRVLKPDGVCVHRVDLKDHLGGGLNNLRFSDATWEGPLFRGSGFYTNRIRFGEMVAVFARAGFVCSLPRVIRWDSLPLPRSTLHDAFRHLPDDDLLVSDFDIVLKPARGPA